MAKSIAIEIYDAMFKEGDQVIVITDDDDFLWGKMHTELDYLVLTILDGTEKILWWDQIRFMAHDGFPVRKLMGTDAKTAMIAIKQSDTAALIRTAAILEFSKIHDITYCSQCHMPVARNTMELTTLQKAGYPIVYCGNLYAIETQEVRRELWHCPDCATTYVRAKDTHVPTFWGSSPIKRGSRYFGDPWRIEDFSASLVNPGAGGAARLAWDPYGIYEEFLILNHQNGAKGMLWELETVCE